MIGLIERLFFSLGLVHVHIFLSFLLLLALLDTEKRELENFNFLVYVLQLGFLKYVSANFTIFELSFACTRHLIFALRNPNQVSYLSYRQLLVFSRPDGLN